MINIAWYCDSCGREIKNASDGWVEWKTNSDHRGYGMRLVHHRNNCQYNGAEVYRQEKATLSDLDLGFFSSQNGLMDLLQMISDDQFLDKEEVLEMIKRIHINGYEKVRNYLDLAISEGVFDPNTKPGYPLEYQIKMVSDWMDKQGIQ